MELGTEFLCKTLCRSAASRGLTATLSALTYCLAYISDLLQPFRRWFIALRVLFGLTTDYTDYPSGFLAFTPRLCVIKYSIYLM